MIAVMCDVTRCVNGPAAHRRRTGVPGYCISESEVCKTENCANGPERHSFVFDVTRPVEDQPNCCRPANWAPPRVGVIRPLRDDPVTMNAEGGSQSVIHETFTTLPLRALRAIAQLQRLGDGKYGAHNWRKISETDHLDHAFAHMLGHSSGDQTEDHLLHAAWRLLAALEQQLTERETNG